MCLVARAMQAQSCDYLVKPVSPDLLLRTVAGAGERWQRRRAEEALRTTEERNRLLIENIADLILVIDRGGVENVLRLQLSSEEIEKLRHSAEVLKTTIRSLELG